MIGTIIGIGVVALMFIRGMGSILKDPTVPTWQKVTLYGMIAVWLVTLGGWISYILCALYVGLAAKLAWDETQQPEVDEELHQLGRAYITEVLGLLKYPVETDRDFDGTIQRIKEAGDRIRERRRLLIEQKQQQAG